MKTFKNKKELQDAIKRNITTSDKQAIKAMLRIFDYQSLDEKCSFSVRRNNGVGFAVLDAELFTSFCFQYQNKGFLTPKQVSIVKSKIGKYAGQLMNQAIQKGIYVKKDGFWQIAENN